MELKLHLKLRILFILACSVLAFTANNLFYYNGKWLNMQVSIQYLKFSVEKRRLKTT